MYTYPNYEQHISFKLLNSVNLLINFQSYLKGKFIKKKKSDITWILFGKPNINIGLQK